MSQGEKQRVAIARAMANRAELVLADEPTGSLESRQGFNVIRLLHDQARERKACVLVASHDLRLAEFADRAFRLGDGTLCPWIPDPRTVSEPDRLEPGSDELDEPPGRQDMRTRR